MLWITFHDVSQACLIGLMSEEWAGQCMILLASNSSLWMFALWQCSLLCIEIEHQAVSWGGGEVITIQKPLGIRRHFPEGVHVSASTCPDTSPGHQTARYLSCCTVAQLANLSSACLQTCYQPLLKFNKIWICQWRQYGATDLSPPAVLSCPVRLRGIQTGYSWMKVGLMRSIPYGLSRNS